MALEDPMPWLSLFVRPSCARRCCKLRGRVVRRRDARSAERRGRQQLLDEAERCQKNIKNRDET